MQLAADMETAGSSLVRRSIVALVAVGCFVAVFGARVAYVDRFGTDLPMWDQWDAESELLLLPHLEGRLRLADFFIPHNEHRIVPTKMLALALLMANGQWDGRLECAANAVLYALLAVAVCLYGRRMIAPRWHVVWSLAILALFAAPIAWHNIIGGFHTQQPFLIGFSLAAIAFLSAGRTFSLPWILGMLCSIAALFSMASGLLAPIAVVCMLALSTPPRTLLRRHGMTIAVCATIAALGWMTKTEVPHHAQMRAASIQDFVLGFWRSMQWPVLGVWLFPILAWMPWACLAWRVWKQAGASSRAERVVVGAGIWVLLQFAAAAYARGAGGPWPANRYLDTVAIGLSVNALSLLVFFSRVRMSGWKAALRISLALIAAALFAHGWWRHIDETWRVTGPVLARDHAEAEANTRAYLRSGDIADLKKGTIPYPGAEALVQRLRHEAIRKILPASVRAPLALSASESDASGFGSDAVSPERPAPRGWPVVGSFTETGAPATGEWQSDPVAPGTFNYWLLPLAADSNESTGLSLHLEHADGRPADILIPGSWRKTFAGTSWRKAVISAPDGPVRLLAQDRSADGWIGFGAPVEMATLSCWSYRLGRAGLVLFWVGAGIVVVVGSPVLALARRMMSA